MSKLKSHSLQSLVCTMKSHLSMSFLFLIIKSIEETSIQFTVSNTASLEFDVSVNARLSVFRGCIVEPIRNSIPHLKGIYKNDNFYNFLSIIVFATGLNQRLFLVNTVEAILFTDYLIYYIFFKILYSFNHLFFIRFTHYHRDCEIKTIKKHVLIK